MVSHASNKADPSTARAEISRSSGSMSSSENALRCGTPRTCWAVRTGTGNLKSAVKAEADALPCSFIIRLFFNFEFSLRYTRSKYIHAKALSRTTAFIYLLVDIVELNRAQGYEAS